MKIRCACEEVDWRPSRPDGGLAEVRIRIEDQAVCFHRQNIGLFADMERVKPIPWNVIVIRVIDVFSSMLEMDDK